MKPIICVLPSLFPGEKDDGHQVMSIQYSWMLRDAGALPLMCDYVDDPDPADIDAVLDRCDGLLLTGGNDVDASYYGEQNLPQTKVSLPARDRTEFPFLRRALERDLPVLGVCRGIQVLDVACGGTLWQDLSEQGATSFDHAQYERSHEVVEEVDLVGGSPIAERLGLSRLGVNSCHHQAIRRLGEGLEVQATSPDGIVEAVWMPRRRFVWGVQWHPECLYQEHPEQLAIAQAFVDACR